MFYICHMCTDLYLGETMSESACVVVIVMITTLPRVIKALADAYVSIRVCLWMIKGK